MTNINTAVAVFTSRSKDEIIQRAGTGNWGASPDRIMQNRYVVVIRNRNENAHWHQNDFDHGTAFLIGRVSGVAETDETTKDDRMRYVIEFDAYAEIDVPDAWGKSRNPVWFTNLDELGIDLNDVEFVSVEDGATVKPSVRPSTDDGLSFAKARRGLATRYGVALNNVEIVLRG